MAWMNTDGEETWDFPEPEEDSYTPEDYGYPEQDEQEEVRSSFRDRFIGFLERLGKKTERNLRERPNKYKNQNQNQTWMRPAGEQFEDQEPSDSEPSEESPEAEGRHHRRHPNCRAGCRIFAGLLAIILAVIGFSAFKYKTARSARVFKIASVLFHIGVTLLTIKCIAGKVIRMLGFIHMHGVHRFFEEHRFSVPLLIIGAVLVFFYLVWAFKVSVK